MNGTDQPLRDLYPFLHGGKKDPAAAMDALLDSARAKARHSVAEKRRFFADNAQPLVDMAVAVAGIYRDNKRVYTMGNGGSSCDAAHFAVEFQHPITAGRPALPAVNLCNDTAMISAVANDVGVDHVFARQIEAQAEAGDGLMGFSTSGNSENLLAAYARGREMGLVNLGLCGGNGGAMASSGLLDHCLVVATDSIHRVQEAHVACYHILWDLVHTLLSDDRGAAAAEKREEAA